MAKGRGKESRTDWWVVAERIIKVLEWVYTLRPYIDKVVKWI
jgi:hypothetical protein